MATSNYDGFGTRLRNFLTGKREIQNAFNQAFYKFVGGGYTAYDTQLSSYLDYGYNINPIVYSVINQMSTKTMSIPFSCKKIKDEQAKKELKNFAFYDYNKTPALYLEKAKMSDRAFEETELPMPLERPNPYQSWEELWALSKVFLRLTGNIYYYMVSPEDGKNKGVPSQLYVLPSHMIKIIIKNDANFLLDESPVLEYGLIDGDSMTRFPADQVIHVKLPNPNFGESGEHLYGQSPLRASIKNMQSSNEALQQNVKMMKNSGSYGFISGKNIPMTQQQADQIKSRLIEMENDTGILSNYAGVSAEVAFTRLSLTTDELKPFDYLNFDQKQICNVLGWSDKLLNNDAGAKYDNVSQFRKQVVTDNIIPDCMLIADALQDFLNRFKGYESTNLMFHAQKLPEMQQDTEKMASWMTHLLDRGVISRNEMRTALQFTELDDKEMEVHTVQMNVIPIQMALQEPETPNQDDDNTDEEGDDAGKFKAGFNPSQPRAENGQWGSNDDSNYDYRIQHQISFDPTFNATLDNMTRSVSGEDLVPDDFYTHPEWYADMGRQPNKESWAVINSVRGKPDAMVTIYRAVPTGVSKINNGDWITLSKTYATEHSYGAQGRDPWGNDIDGIVLSMKVKAKNVVWDGNDINEFAYYKNTKAGFDPNQPRADDGQWGSGTDWRGEPIDDDEIAAINEYTDENFEYINEYLGKGGLGDVRYDDSGNPITEERIKADIVLMERGLEKMKTDYAHNGTVYRGDGWRTHTRWAQTLESFEKSKNTGAPVVYKTFMSTSQERYITEGFMYGEYKILYKIQSRGGGVRIDHIAALPSEREVLFAHGTKFKVKDIISNAKNPKYKEIILEQQ